MQAQFKFYEVVKIRSSRQEVSEINEREGTILGMVQNDQGDWSYTVSIFDTDECWDVQEKELSATGRMMSREDYYGGESIAVEVDSKTGRGEIKKSE